MLRPTKLQTLCKETCSQGCTKTSTKKSTLTDLIAEARSEIAVKSTKPKLKRYLEEWERRLRHFLHSVFSHNYITPSYNCRVASATRTKTFSTFRMYFSAKSNTTPSLYNLNTQLIFTGRKSLKK